MLFDKMKKALRAWIARRAALKEKREKYRKLCEGLIRSGAVRLPKKPK